MLLRTHHFFLLLLAGSACASPGSSLSVMRDGLPYAVEIEGGALFQSRNDVRIPGDGGTRFPLDDLTGNGGFPVARLSADWDINRRHALRLVHAPIAFDGTGTLSESTVFDGETFAPGVPTRGRYQFDNYRLTYRYTFRHDEHWRLRVGGTLFVRDAEIELDQGATRASDANVGLVPLLHLAAEYTPAEEWFLVAELDGLASAQGRAFDLSFKGYYNWSDTTSLSLGYRTIEGGADNDDVYSFAWLHAVVVSLRLRF